MAQQNDLFRKNIFEQAIAPYIPKGRLVCTQSVSARSAEFQRSLLIKLVAFNDQVEPQRFEVQHYTLCQGWSNTWTVTDEEGVESPHTFTDEHDAQAELDEFLDDIALEIKRGERAADEGYSRDEFRVRPLQSNKNVFNEECDPNGWHDMGVIEMGDETVWFKFDYYDLNFEHGVEDPSDLKNTRRVLTLMFPSDY
jgi:hypothetical protein